MITDKLRSYDAAKRVMPSVEHSSHKGLNNRAENSQVAEIPAAVYRRLRGARACAERDSCHSSRDGAPWLRHRALAHRAALPAGEDALTTRRLAGHRQTGKSGRKSVDKLSPPPLRSNLARRSASRKQGVLQWQILQSRPADVVSPTTDAVLRRHGTSGARSGSGCQ